MKTHRLVNLFGFVAIVLFGQTATAASIALTPSSSIVQAGEEFELEFFLDGSPEANDPNGPHPGNFCGEVRIDYDPNLLTFRAQSEQLQLLDPEVGVERLANGREVIRFEFNDVAFNEEPDAGVVGMFTFQASTDLYTTATVNIADNGVLGSTFLNHMETGENNEFTVAPSAASVQIQSPPTAVPPVPLPAAAWLFLSALGALGVVRRKAKQAQHIA